MKNMAYIAPLFNTFFKNKLFWNGFVAGRNLRCFNYCAKATPELSWDINADFPFDPACIPKIKDRKIRKACYQSLSRYKKSFKPRPKPKLKIIWDEWKTDDLADAITYAFFSQSLKTKQEFERQYLCTWDLAAEDSRNAS